MNRRQFLKKCAATGAGGYLLSSKALDIKSRPEHYNVLFIAIDDLNDWIGCLAGHPDAVTPNMDRLAKRGVLFTNAHCAAPACNPSRASLMTGIMPYTSGVYKNGDPWRNYLPDAVTLPQHFMANGYNAIGRGKIYHGSWPDLNDGAWTYYIEKGSDPDPDEANPRYGNPTGNIEWGPVLGNEEDMDDYKVATWVSDRLNDDHKKPFFLACGFYKPHLAWCVPQKYFDKFLPQNITLPNMDPNDLDDVPPEGINMAKPNTHNTIVNAGEWENAVAGYLASGNFTDDQVGRVLDALDASGHADDTIIILWSDHGWSLGEKLHWKKFALWEEATHNLLMMVVPGLTPKNARCDQPVNLTDIYPTLVELCDLTPNDALEGKSLVPFLKKPSHEWERPAITTHGANNHSLRTKRWRYIQYNDGTEELYDRDADPLEWNNLLWGTPLPEHRTKANELKAWLPEFNY
jgi:arylsulfatase A-like enzyme